MNLLELEISCGANEWLEYGNDYMYNSVSSGTIYPHVEKEGVFYVRFALLDYPYDTVYLSPAFSRIYAPDQPIVISLS